MIIIRGLFILILLSNCSFLDKKSNLDYLAQTCLDLDNFKKNYVGITREQVVYIFGKPIISDYFDDAYHYIICNKNNDNKKQMLNLYFQDNKVLRFDVN